MNGNNRIHKALLPLAWIYGRVMRLRNWLFDRGVFKSEKFSVPVISIGNLTAGGAGKTPHTEYLIRLLSKKYKVAVLSRGYKRKSKGYILADKTASARSIGDEPFQMYRKFSDILVVVDSNRRRGIKNLLSLPENHRPEIILLDDAFQHRRVIPSLSILLIDSRRSLEKDALLPAGRLREPISGSKRADVIIYTKNDPLCHPALDTGSPNTDRGLRVKPAMTEQPVFSTSYQYKSLLPVFPKINSVKKESIERLKKEGYDFLLVAGLANPEDLENYLAQYTPGLHSLIFPDHHFFSRKDMKQISNAFNKIKNSRKIIITSEKDATRLVNNYLVPEALKIFLYYLPIEVVFQADEEQLFTQKIEHHVKDFARNRILA